MSRQVDQLLIGRVLGGVAVPGGRARFGNMGLLRTVAESIAERPEVLPDISFSDSDDQIIAKAFERVREGLAADRLLADPELAELFVSACKRLGLKYPAADINRRLLRLRKAAGGGKLKPTTRRDSHPGLIERFGPAVEFALIKMSVRGISVDDALADPAIGAEFERIARAVIPGGRALEYRVCALQIRKCRHFNKREASLFDKLPADKVRFENAGTLATPKNSRSPHEEGLVLLRDESVPRPLYLARYEDVHDGIDTLASRKLAERITAQSTLLSLDPKLIRVEFARKAHLEGAPIRLWELHLIRQLNPALNWPVKAA